MNKLNSILNWSMRVGKLFGIPISLHISILFFLWPVIRSRQDDPIHALQYVVMVVVSILIHELGHALTAKRYKLTGLSIMLHGFGGFATSSGDRNWKQSLVITIMGPATTFALGLICVFVGNTMMPQTTYGTEAFEQAFLIYSIGKLNLLLGVINMIPVLPWDGGNALRAILNRKLTYIKSVRAVAHLGMIVGPLVLAYCLLRNQNFLFVFALISVIVSYQTLAGTGGIDFGEVFADRKDRQAMEARSKREAAKKQAYLDEVRDRMTEREEKERLRKMFEVVEGDEK